MSIETLLSGTDWTHGLVRTSAAVLLISSGAILLSSRAMKRPAFRYALLLSAALACFLATMVGLSTTLRQHPVIPIPVTVASAASNNSISKMPADYQKPVVPPRPSSRPLTEGSDRSFARPSTAEIDPTATMEVSTRGFEVLAVAWLCGSLFVAMMSFRSFQKGKAFRSDCRSMDDPAARASYSAAQSIVGLRNEPKLLESPRANCPMVHGVFAPAVILPANLVSQVSPKQLKAIFVHELAHIRRGDTWIVVIERCVKSLLWPIPTVHWLLHHLDQAREDVCDNFVLSTDDPIDYGEALLRIAEVSQEPPAFDFAVGIWKQPGTLERRVASLLDDRRSTSKTISVRSFVGILSCALAVAVFATGTGLVVSEVTAQETPKPTDATTGEAAQGEAEREAAKRLGVPSSKKASRLVKILDWKGNPIQSAVVTTTELGYADRSGTSSWRVQPPTGDAAFTGKTDEHGEVEVTFPASWVRGETEFEMEPDCFQIKIEAPGFAERTEIVSIDGDTTFKLPRAVKLRFTATLERTNQRVTSRLFGQCKDPFRCQWDGESFQTDFLPTDSQLRLVYRADDQSLWFSDMIDLATVASRDSADLHRFVLHPAIHFEGQLSDEVERPVTGGYVMAAATVGEKTEFWSAWHTHTTINEDGTFTLDDLPNDCHVQLIAICDDWISKPSSPLECEEYTQRHGMQDLFFPPDGNGWVGPRLYKAAGNADLAMIPMQRCAAVTVSVADANGKPISDVDVKISGNQHFLGTTSSSLGQLISTFESFAGRSATGNIAKGADRYWATTDKYGVATVRNLPANTGWRRPNTLAEWRQTNDCNLQIRLSHPDYVQSPSTKDPKPLPGYEWQEVSVTPGETTKVQLVMNRRQPQ